MSNIILTIMAVAGLILLIAFGIYGVAKRDEVYAAKVTSAEYKENFKSCMDSASNVAPISAHYNDLDETIAACRRYAREVTK